MAGSAQVDDNSAKNGFQNTWKVKEKERDFLHSKAENRLKTANIDKS